MYRGHVINRLAARKVTPCAVLAALIMLAPCVTAASGQRSVGSTPVVETGTPTKGTLVWGDYDSDGDQDFQIVEIRGGARVSRVYQNIGAGTFRAVTECTTENGVTVCEGDQSGGISIASASAAEVWVQNLTSDITPEEGIAGIEVTIQGSNGANRGDGFVVGPPGGAGQAGADASVLFIGDGFEIVTTGDNAVGIAVTSRGGKGGSGGTGYGIILPAFGGNGGAGGKGGNVTVESHGAITTSGNAAHGIAALSQGGNGGAGGGAYGFVGDGGDGGAGAGGGSVSVLSDSRITTSGGESHGILAQSLGGIGGSGGAGGGIVAWGGGSRPSGKGGDVDVTNAGTILTAGAESHGIFAQSIGGFGGGGGGSGGIVSFGGIGQTGGNGGNVAITNIGAIETTGNGSASLLAQSIGGGGGSGAGSGGLVSLGGTGSAGGHGGDLTVANSGALQTEGIFANGILAQSIGGGGGRGAGSGGLVSIGGSGSSTGDGGDVRVENSGAVVTDGDFSNAIHAQSIGGGGGSGGGSGGLFSFGGSGAAGGHGDSVNVSHSGEIETSGSDASGIFAQSVGGGGGNGGGSGSVSAYVGVAVGGSGGPGGNGSSVLVSADDGLISTTGDRSYGIHAQSVGGGGGNGGFAFSVTAGDKFAASIAIGGSGSTGGSGGAVEVDTGIDIATEGERAHGIMAESVGGGGGSGGFSLALSASSGPSASLSLGGSGAKGGNAGAVSVLNRGNIGTSGYNAYGVMAQSVGGGGGDGGGSIAGSASGKLAIAASFGGGGGPGGHGGRVSVLNEGQIGTLAEESHGIFAQSLGGGGGSGGFSVHVAGSSENSLSFGLGGAGTSGGLGGMVDVSNAGIVTTTGDRSYGILAQSVGGGGGSGGSTYHLGGASTKHDISLSIGGAGGQGGDGSRVTVDNGGTILTVGAQSHGVFAQSVGGGGGDGGSNTTITVPTPPSSAALGAQDRTLNVAASLSAAGETPLEESKSLKLNVSVGGKGGAAGDGGSVLVANAGDIGTEGALSNGIFAQSVGGGGGSGGTNLNIRLPGIPGGPKDSTSLNLNFSIGGAGGAAGDGDSVTVANAGNIQTAGDLSHGIFTQSVGGGGGSEIAEIDNPLSDAGPYLRPKGINITIGGDGGASGDGGAVAISNTGDIATTGLSSYGIFAQSVGGGGGQGAEADAGLKGAFSLGGRGGASGDGGTIDVANAGTIATFGETSHGIFAQSVGGGGGVGGDVKRGLGALNVGIGIGVGGDGTNAGDGGDVTIDNAGDIATRGDNSIGIFAQSVGGGGGIGGGAGNESIFDLFSFAGSSGGAGSGGTVSVTHEGRIVTEGYASHGVFAQSAGGESGGDDRGNAVDVTVTGDVLAYGEDAHGIMAQSLGSEANGDITVDISDGSIQGGSGSGAGVLLLDGAHNVLTNRGTISTLGGHTGWAIQATGGDEFIDNYGTITGSIDLGGGFNQFHNEIGSVLEVGTTIDMGGGTLINDGIFSPGGASGTITTEFTGNYEQTGSGTFELTVCGSEQDQLLFTGAGTADLSGTLKIVADHEAYVDGTTYDIIKTPDPQQLTGQFTDIVLPQTAFLDFDMDYAEGAVRVTVDVTPFTALADNSVESAIANVMDDCATHATGDMSHLIGEFQLASQIQVNEAFGSLSPGTYDNLSRGTLQSVRLHEDALAQRVIASRAITAATHDATEAAMVGRSSGWWLSGSRQSTDQDSRGGYQEHNFSINGVLGGYERVEGHTILGGSVGTTRTDVDLASDMAHGTTNSIIGSLYGGYRWGRTFAQAVLSYATSDLDNRRDVHVGTLDREARSSYGGNIASALVTGGRRFLAGRWNLEPFASVRYSHVAFDGFAEEGAGSANLAVASRTSDWLASDLGIRFVTRYGSDAGWFVPELSASWNHDFAIDDRMIHATFAGDADASFAIDGQDIGRDGANLGVGLAYHTANGWTASIRYDRQQRADFQANGLSIRVGSGF